MNPLSWYWHRLRAMSPGEMARHARKTWRQAVDARRIPTARSEQFHPSPDFPRLPAPGQAPDALRAALRRDADALIAGRWRAFGHLPLTVDDPPRWHHDYLAGCGLDTGRSAFQLNHRALPQGADIKLIWELSRWHALVRLAMAAYVLDDNRAAMKCLEWLEDWCAHNPPYRGWNWTSALEVGMRLIQFTWIDALLTGSGSGTDRQARLGVLRRAILPSHVAYAWRHRSFGSSANNHLLGELTGLMLATARWPEVQRWGAELGLLHRLWEQEILFQFAEDGGNREQALNYQLFSFEFGWQGRLALQAAGRSLSDAVTRRLITAARFFWEVQSPRDPWDYGDSDSAFVTPWFLDERHAVEEWHHWIGGTKHPTGLAYWLGDVGPTGSPRLGVGDPLGTKPLGDWWFYRQSGIAIASSGFWFARWDLSPLGYLATAAHGHLDALHFSLWHRGVAIVIDPGTGAYYADKTLRSWLASREAHNGPTLPPGALPQRLGPFLWSGHHAIPNLLQTLGRTEATWQFPGGNARRRISSRPDSAWVVLDEVEYSGRPIPFVVRWQFAPGTTVKILDRGRYRIKRGAAHVEMDLDPSWADVALIETPEDRARLEPEHPLAGTVSPAFRQTTFAPYLLLKARPAGDKPCLFRTTFLASDAA